MVQIVILGVILIFVVKNLVYVDNKLTLFFTPYYTKKHNRLLVEGVEHLRQKSTINTIFNLISFRRHVEHHCLLKLLFVPKTITHNTFFFSIIDETVNCLQMFSASSMPVFPAPGLNNLRDKSVIGLIPDQLRKTISWQDFDGLVTSNARLRCAWPHGG